MSKLTFSVRLPVELVRRVDDYAPHLVAPGMPRPSRSEAIAGLLERALSATVPGGPAPTPPPPRKLSTTILPCSDCHAPTSEAEGAKVTSIGTFCPACARD